MRWKLAILTCCLSLGLSGTVFAQNTAKEQSSRINAVETFSVEERDAGTFIRIAGSKVPTFSVFKLNDPLRLFIDVSNSALSGEAKTHRVNNGVISQVALLEFQDNVQSVTRVIIGFDQAAHYDVRTEGHDVVVYVDGAKRSSANNQVAEMSRALQERESRLKAMEAQYLSEAQSADVARKKLNKTEDELARLREQLSKASGDEKQRVTAAISAKNRDLDRVKADLVSRERALASVKGEVKSLEKERDSALALADKKQREGEEARKEARRLEKKLLGVEASLAKAQTKATTSNSRVQSAQKELQTAREREAQLEARLASLQKAKAQGNSQASDELKRVQQDRAAARQVLAERETALSDARASLTKRDMQLAQMQRKLEAARADRDRVSQDASKAESDRVKALERALSEERSRVASLRADKDSTLAKNRRLQDIEGELLAARGEIEALRREKLRTEAAPKGVAARAIPVEPNNAVRGIRLETTGDRSRIVVELDRPGNFETLPWKDSRAVMILNGVELPAELEKTLQGRGQSGAVRFVSSYRDNQGRVRLEAELGQDATEVVRQEGNQLVWEFAPALPTEFAGVQDKDQSRPEAGSFTAAPPGYPVIVTDPTRVSRVPGMSRKRLTIDLREADISNVLRMLAKEGGVNIVAGNDVGGSVTLRLRSVPLDEVFLTVLQARSLGFEKRGNVIRVAPQATLLDEQSKRAEARAKSAMSKPLEVFLVPVNYADASEMAKQVDGVLGPRGSVSIDTRTNTLVIKDIAENLAAVRSLVESLDTQVPQVLIEARIVETNDTFSQSLGIQWGGDVSWSQANGNPTGLVFPSVVGLSGGATDSQTPLTGSTPQPNFAVNLPAPAGTGAGGAIGLTLGSIGGALNLNLRLSAAEASGYTKIVSAPKILTLDNRAATISQGTSIPISVVSAAGVQTVFVDATLELTVTPHVTPDGNIQLAISASKNEPDFQNTGARGDPTIIRKQAQTELLIKDGDTTVIGGIYTRNSGTSLSAVPFFHKIPILGWFFKSTSQSEQRTELLIFITPKIVNRAESIAGVANKN